MVCAERLGHFTADLVHRGNAKSFGLADLGADLVLHGQIAKPQILQRPDRENVDVSSAAEMAEAIADHVAAAAVIPRADADGDGWHQRTHAFLPQSCFISGNIEIARCNFRAGHKRRRFHQGLQRGSIIHQLDQRGRTRLRTQANRRVGAQPARQFGGANDDVFFQRLRAALHQRQF